MESTKLSKSRFVSINLLITFSHPGTEKHSNTATEARDVPLPSTVHSIPPWWNKKKMSRGASRIMRGSIGRTDLHGSSHQWPGRRMHARRGNGRQFTKPQCMAAMTMNPPPCRAATSSPARRRPRNQPMARSHPSTIITRAPPPAGRPSPAPWLRRTQ